MYEDDNKRKIKEMKCKRKEKMQEKIRMHEDDNKHNIKEMECKRKENEIK